MIARQWGQQKPPSGTQLQRGHPLAQGLVGRWLFNEGAGLYVHDCANNNGGKLSGTTTPAWRTGNFGPALSFDGTNAYVDCGSTPTTTDLFLTPGTVSFWVSPIDAGDEVIMGKNDNNTVNAGWWIRKSGDFHFVVEYSTTNMRCVVISGLPLNVWTHVVVVGSGGTTYASQAIYFNGLPQTFGAGSTDGSGTQGTDAGETLYFGFNRDGGGGKFAGYLDNITMLKRAITPSEMWQLYHQPFLDMQPAALRRWPVGQAVAGAPPAPGITGIGPLIEQGGGSGLIGGGLLRKLLVT